MLDIDFGYAMIITIGFSVVIKNTSAQVLRPKNNYQSKVPTKCKIVFFFFIIVLIRAGWGTLWVLIEFNHRRMYYREIVVHLYYPIW